eukprot:369343_1
MGNIQSTTKEWDQISERNPDNPNERWTFIFRYVCGVLGISSSVLATYLVYLWTKMEKVGGTSWRTPNKPFHPKGYINSHALAMTTSFCLLMAPSMTTFEMWPLERHTNKDIHNYMNTLALLSGLGGLGMAIDYNKWGEIKSVHAVIGYGAITLLVFNFLAGFTMYVLGYGGKMRGTLKPLHKRAGFFALLAGMTNVIVGLMYKQAANRYNQDTRKAMNRIAGVLIFAMFNIYCCVGKFADKKDPPKDEDK